VFNGDYQAVPESDTTVPGIIDEAGAFRNVGELPPGPGNKVVFRAAFTATATGVATIVTDPADEVLDPGPPPVLGNHDTLIYFPPSAVPIDQITYLGGSVIIIGGSAEGEFHNYYSPNDVNGDNRVTPFDALAIIAKIRGTNGAIGEGESVDVPSAGHKYFYDTNNDRTVSVRDILSVVRELAAMQASSTFNEDGEGEAVFGALPGAVSTSLVQSVVANNDGVTALPSDPLVIHVGLSTAREETTSTATKPYDSKPAVAPIGAPARSTAIDYDEAIRQLVENTDDQGDVDQDLLKDLLAAWQKKDE